MRTADAPATPVTDTAPAARNPAAAAPSRAAPVPDGRRGEIMWRLAFELVIVFAGVTAAFAVDDWRSHRESAARVAQINAAISQELAAFVAVGQQMCDSMAAGWQRWQQEYQAGGEPVPYYYFLPEFERPPMDAWHATIASGGIGLLEPQRFLELAIVYGRLETLVERYDRLTAFAESQILPHSGDGSAAFYIPGAHRLRAQYEAYHARRLAVQEEFSADVDRVRTLLERFDSAAARP
jgi:hypothetical protein